MIGAKLLLEDDRQISLIWLRAKPTAGELIWITGERGARLREEFGTSSFQVTEVAHWVSEEWSPNTHVGKLIHSLALYVKPIRPGAPEEK